MGGEEPGSFFWERNSGTLIQALQRCHFLLIASIFKTFIQPKFFVFFFQVSKVEESLSNKGRGWESLSQPHRRLVCFCRLTEVPDASDSSSSSSSRWGFGQGRKGAKPGEK